MALPVLFPREGVESIDDVGAGVGFLGGKIFKGDSWVGLFSEVYKVFFDGGGMVFNIGGEGGQEGCLWGVEGGDGLGVALVDFFFPLFDDGGSWAIRGWVLIHICV